MLSRELEKRFLVYLNLLTPKELKILKDLFFHEPDCAKFIARRIRYDLKEVLDGLKLLENLKIIERVTIPLMEKGRKIKHYNYGYYEIKKEWRQFLKNIFLEGAEYDPGDRV